jgi:DNA mismatch repair protein MutL
MSIKNLSKETIRFISSGQVITSITSVIKELVENSIDANSTSIECKLVGGGYTSIIVKDNGIGIPLNDRQYIGNRYCTSKLPDGSFENISKVTTYGFRGEALNSIATISQSFSIETRTKDDIIGKIYQFDHMGNIISETPTNTTLGTTIQIIKIFYNTPVRKQAALKQKNNSIKSILELLTSYALIYPNIRFSFKHSGNISNKISKRKVNATYNNSNVEWHSIICNSTMDSIKHLFGSDLTSQLCNISKKYPIFDIDKREEEGKEGKEEKENNAIKNDDPKFELKNNEKINFVENIEINSILFKPGVDPEKYWRSSTDRIFFYVNKRPIQLSLMPTFKEILKLIKQKSLNLTNNEILSNKKYPFVFLDITVPSYTIDINIEPSKMKIMFHHPQKIIDLIDKLTDEIYPLHNPEIDTPLIFKIPELNKTQSSNIEKKKIIKLVSEQHNSNVNLVNKENVSKISNKIKSNKSKSGDDKSYLKFINEDIGNFIQKRSVLGEQEKDIIERKQRIKRRRLNLSTIDYTTEKFIDIKKCSSNFRKIRLNKNKHYNKNTKIIGFLTNNNDINDITSENFDKYDQFWVIKENNQLIIGSWRRLNELMMYQNFLKTAKIPSKEKIPPIFYKLKLEEENISNSFVYEDSKNKNVKKLVNSFITLNGYEAWFHKYNNTIEVRRVPDISSEYDYFGSLDDIKEIINSLSYISKSLIVQTKTLNISQRPPRLCNYLKSLLPLWCLPNIPLNDISSPFLCLKVSKENLKFSLNYVLTNSRSNNDDIDTINKYESLISPKSKKLIAKSNFRL